ncbi:imidazole glycerol phosphate synthase subunit HisH [Castellaniella sp. S9]|uniref:imidazole glycerol phosphate synthase subunit HisH n=1 Tax=Castellaniella sp. S9 TaxID=2993652 RepID=UPI0022B3DA7C|nr:imidazole glycerol phosphate synthase subunit HisH [Castellaniella sp. S9]
MITIIDLGIGNVGSLENMLLRSKIPSVRTKDADVISRSTSLILPGVGSFDAGMHRLENLGISTAIRNALVEYNASILGICLGMQMLCEGSEEGKYPGLGLIGASSRRLPFSSNTDVRIPHMGWNTVQVVDTEHQLFRDLTCKNRFYFVHSYGVVCNDPVNVLGVTDYGGDFCSSIYSGRIFGVQFHPEKSHKFGKQLLENFAKIE